MAVLTAPFSTDARRPGALSFARETLNRRVFSGVHASQLIYNTCWEDPRLDRQVLGLGPRARVLMITSAGCNALDYLLDDPGRIDCVDLNPKQNALLALKIAALRTLDYPDFYQLFGCGQHPRFDTLYRTRLRPALGSHERAYWDRAGAAFVPSARGGSFYYHGTSGVVAWGVTRFLKAKPRLNEALDRLLSSTTLEEQRVHFERIEPALWNPAFRWFCNRSAALALIGVPAAQRALVEESGGMVDFMRGCLRKVFTTLPVHDNYFWRVYLTGSYSRSCAPNYLVREHFDTLRDRVDRVHVHTASMTEHMRRSRDQWSHFVLLDHQDWLAYAAPHLLAEEWQRMLVQATPTATWILRSGGANITFLPAFVREQVQFSEAASLHALDRVGTYGSFYVGRRAGGIADPPAPLPARVPMCAAGEV